MSSAVRLTISHRLYAVHGFITASLDVVAALSLMGFFMMLVIGLIVGGGEWKLSLFPLISALVCLASSRLYNRVVRKLEPNEASLGQAVPQA